MSLEHLYIFILFLRGILSQFVFDENRPVCDGYLNKNIIRKTWTVKLENENIYFNLCDQFSEKELCPFGTSACLESTVNGRKINLGTNFVLEEESFRSINGEHCNQKKNFSVTINLKCSEKLSDEPSLFAVIEDGCSYILNMRDPKCTPKCTTVIDGVFVDLRNLSKTFSVTNSQGNRNFSVSFCGPNLLCSNKGDVNACQIIGNEILPLSNLSSISVSYDGDSNHLSLHGVTHKPDTKKIDKRFEVVLKCNWDKTEITNNDLKYIEKKYQGSKYQFELETSLGCIKKNIPCVVNDKFLIYDLTGLSDLKSAWTTSTRDSNGRSDFSLQVCGHLRLPEIAHNCTRTYAQVCEHRGNEYINHGSALRHLEIDDDVLIATIENGVRCKEDINLFYKTFINFYCSSNEEGPRLIEKKPLGNNKCETYFSWKTPLACPKFNVSRCSTIHEDFHDCQFQGSSFYNLTPLNSLKRIKHGKNEFLLYICGSINDSEVPCMKDVSIAIKDFKEVNPKYKYLSLGKFFGSSMDNGSLVLEYKTGAFCNGIDYSSKIRFECSTREEEPILVEEKNCYYEFLWKTKYVCTEKRGCTYLDEINNKSIDLSRFNHQKIQFQGSENVFTFDICQENYTVCGHNKGCYTELIKKRVINLSANSSSLTFVLPRSCEQDSFNVVKINFICDNEFSNNDHFISLTVLDCILYLNCRTSLICPFIKNDDIFVVQQLVEKVPIVNSTNKIQSKKCIIKSPFTSKDLNITKLLLGNKFSENGCPTPKFNETHQFVMLFYSTTNRCQITTKNLSYEVYLKCSKTNFITSSVDVCFKHYELESMDVCNLFKPSNTGSHLSRSSVIGLVFGILLLISLIACAAAYVRIGKKTFLGRRQTSYLNIYEKDTGL